jgi:hypothetical protein
LHAHQHFIGRDSHAWPQRKSGLCGDNPRMAQGKRMSADIGGDALRAIKDMGAAAKLARISAGDGQAAVQRKPTSNDVRRIDR